jgi:hypothetical protein
VPARTITRALLIVLFLAGAIGDAAASRQQTRSRVVRQVPVAGKHTGQRSKARKLPRSQQAALHRVDPRRATRPTARPAPRHRSEVRTKRSLVRAAAAGTFIDGPRHTWKAIKRNPKAFILGTVAIGAIGVVGRKLGFDGHYIAMALSGGAVVAQVKAAWPTLRQARGLELARRIGADVVWPVLLAAGSTLIGRAIGGEHAPGHHPPSSGELAIAFAESAVIGGDAPAVAVTALDTQRETLAGEH